MVFFADYQNSDLVGYLQPQPDEIHGATYKFEKGPLIKALNAAFSRPDRPVVLLIEEINRGNAPAIFGELFQLLDRNNSGESQYRVGASSSVLKELEHIQEITETRQIWLPNNLFVVGTMNSSDQGVFPLDTAFKRRFSFKYLPIDYSAHSKIQIFWTQKFILILVTIRGRHLLNQLTRHFLIIKYRKINCLALTFYLHLNYPNPI